MKKLIKVLSIILGIILAIWFGLKWYLKPKPITENNFEMQAVHLGDIRQTVEATGNIQPLNLLSVGTQVSGIIEKLFVDYNDEVKTGQLLAQLDTSILEEDKLDAEAQLASAEAKQRVAQKNYERYKKLRKGNLIAETVLEEAEVNLSAADAVVLGAKADLNKAIRNLDYAIITSPIDGTIISREVEAGQTVAASMTTPTLFTIAEDLTKMQIEANIAEADIGLIKTGMSASFTVDSYPMDTFNGVIKQVRLNPTQESNVIMYTVIIEVDNTSRKLLPGMTAFVNIQIQEEKGAPRLPITTLQYKPNAVVRELITEKINQELAPNQAIVYQFKDGKVIPVVIQKGLSDMSYFKVESGLKEGDKVISEFNQKGKKRP